MQRTIALILVVATVGLGCTGCVSRMIKEGMGVATGASGKVVSSSLAPTLTKYKSLHVQDVTVASDVRIPAEMPGLVRADLEKAAAGRGLAGEGEPAINLSAQIIHYETGGAVDTAIGPLEEVIVARR